MHEAAIFLSAVCTISVVFAMAVISFKRRAIGKRPFTRFWILLLILATGSGLLFAFNEWPYELVATPTSTIRVIDEHQLPISGLRVIREWETSEKSKGHDEAQTDVDGRVNFPRVGIRMNLIKRMTKPVLMFLPAACGPSAEINRLSRFELFLRPEIRLHFDEGGWQRLRDSFQNGDGICIRDRREPGMDPNFARIELSFFNRARPFDFTLTVYVK